MGNDNIIEGLVSTPKPGEADLDNHDGDMGDLRTTNESNYQVVAAILKVVKLDTEPGAIFADVACIIRKVVGRPGIVWLPRHLSTWSSNGG